MRSVGSDTMSSDPIRLLVYEGPDLSYPYRVTPERLERISTRTGVAPFLKSRFVDGDDAFRMHIADADLAMGWRIPTAIVAERGGGLGWIQLTGVGVNHLTPLDWLPRSTELISASGAQCPTAADTAAMALLMLNGRMGEIIANQHAGRWTPAFATPIAGKTVLVVGVGQMGQAVVDIANRLELRVLGISRSGRRRRGVESMATLAQLLGLLPEADFVVLTPALTDKTRGLMSAEAISRMKRGAGLINLGRAALIEEATMIAALHAGQIGGAVLDGYAQEPLPAESVLWRTPNLIALPHVASGEPGLFMDRVVEILCTNLRRCRDGQPLLNRVSRRHGY